MKYSYVKQHWSLIGILKYVYFEANLWYLTNALVYVEARKWPLCERAQVLDYGILQINNKLKRTFKTNAKGHWRPSLHTFRSILKWYRHKRQYYIIFFRFSALLLYAFDSCGSHIALYTEIIIRSVLEKLFKLSTERQLLFTLFSFWLFTKWRIEHIACI